MTRIERSIAVAQSPERVFDALTDLDRLPEWATIVVETGDVSQRPVQAGTTFRQTIRVAGRHLDTDWRVVEWDRPHHVVYEATALLGGRLWMRQRVTPEGDGSRVALEIDYDLPGGILGDIADRAFLEERNQREAEESLGNLQRLLEGRQ